MIKSRYLQHAAVFQKPKSTKSASGQVVEQWEDITRVYVDIRPLAVDKEFDQNVRFEVSRMELKTRYSQRLYREINTNCRVIVKGKTYAIQEIGDVLSRKQLTYIIAAYE